MQMHSPFTKRAAFGLSTLMLVLYGCGSASGGLALPGAAPAAPAPEQVTFEATATFGSGKFILDDPKVGLADLPGYTATLTLSFDGTRDGKPQKWTKTYVMLAGAKPAVRQLTLQRTGDLTDLSTVNMAEQDGASYTWDDKSGCTATAIKTGDSLGDTFEPAGFLHYVVGAQDAGAETVNKIPSKHYTFDQLALGQDGVTESTGELWVATTGGYLVKYLLSSKGKADYFGQGVEGTLTQDYELTGVGAPVVLKLPDDCPPGIIDAPLMPDASQVESAPGSLSYQSATALKDVAAFYKKELPKLGWKAQSDTTVTDTDGFLHFVQGHQDLLLVLTAGSGTTTIDITLGRTAK